MYFKATILVTIFIVINLQAGIGSGESEIGGLPVELTSLSASLQGNLVLLNWSTATEVNNYGFDIEVSTSSTTKTKFQLSKSSTSALGLKRYILPVKSSTHS